VSDYAISVEGLSKRFWLQAEQRTSLKERLVRGRGIRGREFWAVRDATFTVPKGSTFGIVGHNGSGKSTTLKVLAGIYRPTSGTVSVRGRVSALLELGAGFNPELTGRDNIRLNGAILGLSKRQINAAMDEIIEFSGLEEFIDSPVKVYSSGMYVRLGFAIAVSIEPEILVIDEVIAVGDEEFQRRCFDHLRELRRGGTTIVIVSHDLGLVRELCDHAVWLDHGKVRALGSSLEVVETYLRDVNDREAHEPHDASEAPAVVTRRHGSGEVIITGVEYLDASGAVTSMVVAGDPCVVRLHYSAQDDVPEAVFGLGFHHESGLVVSGPNSGRSGPVPVHSGTGYVDFRVDDLLLQPSTYDVSTAIVDKGHTYDYLDRAFTLRVRGSGNEEPGMTRMVGRWSRPRPTGEAQGSDRSLTEGLLDAQP
jgi:ABC-2 type transport system ATP-binding protein/lipopolysaccharide transport system ATP-binding protein